MKEKLIDKIEKEYEFFILDILRTSKANIVAQSGQIETRKRIAFLLKNYIYRMENSDNDFEKKLLYFDNISDELYRLIIEHHEKSIDEIFNTWIKSVEEID